MFVFCVYFVELILREQKGYIYEPISSLNSRKKTNQNQLSLSCGWAPQWQWEKSEETVQHKTVIKRNLKVYCFIQPGLMGNM